MLARRRRLVLGAIPLLLAAACSGGDGEQPGAVTADETRQLNEAAEMLDANSVAPAIVTNDQDRL